VEEQLRQVAVAAVDWKPRASTDSWADSSAAAKT
jgi:hypothetical protein